MTITREAFVDRAEKAVLNVLDRAVQDSFGQARAGWTDGELLALLPAVHRHAKKAYQRLTVHESEPDVPPYEGELWEADPTCAHAVVPASGGGVKCTKCRGWFCF